jgi:hypothetical protein
MQRKSEWCNALVLAVFTLVTVLGCGSEPKDDYGRLRENFHAGISKTLMANQITGCGKFRYRESNIRPGEYKVYCRNWLAYTVWPRIGDVSGPYPSDLKM